MLEAILIVVVVAAVAFLAFVAMRPPGHHAEHATAMGFCFFNNAAIAARHAQKTFGIDRVAIIDWDVHHGNGTQDIFYNDPNVLTISLHQDRLYPFMWILIQKVMCCGRLCKCVLSECG